MHTEDNRALGSVTMREQDYLKHKQYRDASNLNARAQLHARFSANRWGWHRWVFDQLRLHPGCRILEVGCGPGMLWRENLDRMPDGCEAILTDLSTGMLEEARASLGPTATRFRMAAADAQHLPFPDEHVDVVVANHMLYHVPDLEKALAEFRRVLRPAGRFYAATNGRNHMRELHAWLAQFGARLPLGASLIERSFGLGTGKRLLAPWFSEVRLERYEGHLDVREVEPLMAYILSTTAKADLVGEKLEHCTGFFEQILREQGAIRISKDTGLLTAVRGEESA